MATLTSVGNVNLTSATNWSPAQIPADGDILLIDSHQLTLDADLVLSQVFFRRAASRFAIAGTTRSVTATNGWVINVENINGRLCNTVLTAGMNVTLTGTWTGSIWNYHLDGIFASTGGNATLQTVGSDPSLTLFGSPTPGILRCITNSWAGGTLTTIGRIVLSDGHNQVVPVVNNMSAGTWIHNSIGVNHVGALPSTSFAALTGTAQLNWTGSIECNSNFVGSVFAITSNATHTITAPTAIQKNSNGTSTNLFGLATGTINFTGYATSRAGSNVLGMSSGRFNYQNQTVSQPSGDPFVLRISGGTLDFSGLDFTINENCFMSISPTTTVIVDSGTFFNCQTSAIFGAYISAAIEGKVIRLPNPAPTLPPANNVTKDVVYGYAASPIAGTGLIVDPAILAAAVQSGVGLASPNLDTQLAGIATDIDNITVDNAAIATAVWAKDISEATAGTAGAYLKDIWGRITAAVYTMLTNLISMITGTGASAKWTEKALEESPTGSVYILPTKGSQGDGRTTTSTVYVASNQSYLVVRTVTDSSRALVSLTGRTLRFICEGQSGLDKTVIEDVDITVSGTSDATYSCKIPKTTLSKARSLSCVLRDVTDPDDNTKLDSFTLVVEYAADAG